MKIGGARGSVRRGTVGAQNHDGIDGLVFPRDLKKALKGGSLWMVKNSVGIVVQNQVERPGKGRSKRD